MSLGLMLQVCTRQVFAPFLRKVLFLNWKPCKLLRPGYVVFVGQRLIGDLVNIVNFKGIWRSGPRLSGKTSQSCTVATTVPNMGSNLPTMGFTSHLLAAHG